MKKISKIMLALMVVITMMLGSMPKIMAKETLPIEDNISADKQVKALGNNEYQIRFTIPGETKTEKPVIDVMFVLDGSSTAPAAFKTSLISMLEKLAANSANVTYKVGLVMFDQNVYDKSGGLLDITDKSNIEKIKTAINSYSSLGGTNLQGGVMLGKDILDKDTEVPASNKYCITMSDLKGYLFTREPAGSCQEVYTVDAQNSVTGVWTYDGDGRYSSVAAGTYTVDSINNLVTKMIIPFSGQKVSNTAWLTALDDSGSIFPATAGETAANSAVTAGTALIPAVAGANEYTATSYDKTIYLVGQDWLAMKNEGYTEYLLYEPWHGIVENHGSLLKSYSEWFEKYIGPKYSSTATEVTQSLENITSDIINSVHKGILNDVINTQNFTFKEGSVELSYSGKVLTPTDLGGGSYGYGTVTNGIYQFVTSINAAKDTVTLNINAPISDGNKLVMTFIQKYLEGSSSAGSTINTNTSARLDFMNTTEYMKDPNTYTRYMNFTSPTVTISEVPNTADTQNSWRYLLGIMIIVGITLSFIGKKKLNKD